jgi:peptidoglycan/LPS O-acetylase OafA/YrhL
MNTWTPLDAATWTMGQLVTPAICLAALIILFAVAARDKKLLLFFLSLVASEALLAHGGFFERSNQQTLLPLAFLGFQVWLVIFVGRKAKGDRTGAVVLAILCLLYALVAMFVWGMAITGDWI